MYVRLAFAVAAHLDPDVLIVDEVLAVGDASFQKKCLAKMKDVAGEGRTVLFVSHNMGSVKQLCNRAILLKGGKIIEAGDTDKIIDAYMKNSLQVDLQGGKVEILVDKFGLKFKNFKVNGITAEGGPHIASGEPMRIEMDYTSKEVGLDLCVGLSIRSQTHGVYVYYSHSHLEEQSYRTTKKGTISAELQPPSFAAGNYVLELQIWVNGDHVVKEHELCDLQILPTPMFESQAVMESFPAVILLDTDWKFEDK